MYYKSLYPPLPQIPHQNVHNFLFNREQPGGNLPDYPLYVNALTGASRSYRQFLEIVRDGATTMGSDVDIGGIGIRVENGELVGVLSENSMDYVALLHSLIVLTVPFVTLSSYSTPFEFQHAFKLVSPTRLFVSPTLLPLALTSGLPQDRIYILEGRVQGYVNYGDLVARARGSKLPRLPVQEAGSDTLAYLAFSSGTSGVPKAVMISHGNLIHSLTQLLTVFAEALKVQGPAGNGPRGINVTFTVLPLHHAYGLYLSAFGCFLLPTTIVILPKWNVDVYFDSIPKYRVTSTHLVPSLVHQIVHHPRFLTTDFSTVQSLFSSAAHLPASLSERLHSRFPGVGWIGGGYGMTECTVSVSLQPPLPGILGGRAKLVHGSIGILLPGVEARIVREDGQLASLNEPGELYVRSGTVALGYWKNEKATKETFEDGWFRTGDRIRIDADGVLYFEDRAKDILKISGMQVSPTEIEETMRLHPEDLIIDVSVAGVSGGRTADERIPRAWIVLSSKGQGLGATEVTTRLDAWVRETLSGYKWLRGGIAVVDQIPKSPTGKVLRRVLVDEYEAGLRSRETKL